MEFHKVAEADGVEVHRAMVIVPKETPPTTGPDHVWVPEMPEMIDSKLCAAALKAFDGKEVLGASFSTTGGVSVRVVATEPEPCSSCGAEVDASAKFCPNCGASTAKEEA